MKNNDKITNFLIKNYPIYGKNYCMEKMNLTEGQVRSRMARRQIKVNKNTELYHKRQRNPLKITAPTNPTYKTEEYRLKCIEICKHRKKRVWTKENRENVAKSMKSWWIKNPNHNNYKKGFKFTDKQLENISKGVKKSWKNMKTKHHSEHRRQAISDHTKQQHADGVLGRPEYAYSRCKHGEFNDGIKKYYMRSRWERNYAWYLNFLIKQKQIIDWEYEIDTFWFEKILRGVRSYKPDFKVFNKDGSFEYHEVKGWMDPKSKTKLKRFKKYYPKEKLVLIDSDVYKEISKSSKLFPGWENN